MLLVTEPMNTPRWMPAERYLDHLEQKERTPDEDSFGNPLAELLELFLGPSLQGASCVDMTDQTVEHLFYPDPHATIGTLAAARSVCFNCPALRECLRGALERNERYGIWAGTSRRNRIRIRVMLAQETVTMDQVLNDFVAGTTSRYDMLKPGPLDEQAPA